MSNAEILLWQGKFRRTLVLLAGFGTLGLKWGEVISSDSVVARLIGADAALLIGAGQIMLYFAFIQLMMRYVKKSGHAGHGAIVATVVADMLLLFAIVFTTTPPSEYSRALILSIFTLQFTQLYYGQKATLYHLATVVVFFTMTVLAAGKYGATITPAELFWDMAIVVFCVLLFAGLQGQMAERLRRIVSVFEKAQTGDFSIAYDETADKMPDAITVVGRAYNRMRGHLETIVLTDPLSGCYNRRGFDQLVTREVSRAVRGGHPLSVLAIDVDHFKRINDEFGHLTGDEVLREMGALLRDTARLGDVVARIGGEEFEILAPDTNAEGAQILADRLMQAFHSRPFSSVGGRRTITISIGVGSDVARNDQIAGTLMARADEALYVAKRNGRDRTETWHPGMRAFDGSLPGRRSIEARAMTGDEPRS